MLVIRNHSELASWKLIFFDSVCWCSSWTVALWFLDEGLALRSIFISCSVHWVLSYHFVSTAVPEAGLGKEWENAPWVPSPVQQSLVLTAYSCVQHLVAITWVINWYFFITQVLALRSWSTVHDPRCSPTPPQLPTSPPPTPSVSMHRGLCKVYLHKEIPVYALPWSVCMCRRLCNMSIHITASAYHDKVWWEAKVTL